MVHGSGGAFLHLWYGSVFAVNKAIGIVTLKKGGPAFDLKISQLNSETLRCSAQCMRGSNDMRCTIVSIHYSQQRVSNASLLQTKTKKETKAKMRLFLVPKYRTHTLLYHHAMTRCVFGKKIKSTA